MHSAPYWRSKYRTYIMVQAVVCSMTQSRTLTITSNMTWRPTEVRMPEKASLVSRDGVHTPQLVSTRKWATERERCDMEHCIVGRLICLLTVHFLDRAYHTHTSWLVPLHWSCTLPYGKYCDTHMHTRPMASIVTHTHTHTHKHTTCPSLRIGSAATDLHASKFGERYNLVCLALSGRV